MDQQEVTRRCLQTLMPVRRPNIHLLVLDNGSKDATGEMIREQFPAVDYHYSSENMGVAGGRNHLAKLAQNEYQPDYFVILDNDTIVEPDFIDKLHAPFAEDDKLAITSPKIKVLGEPDRLYGAGGCRVNFYSGKTMHRGYGEVDTGRYDSSSDCVASGGCMMIRAPVFWDVNGFDLTFNPYGPEDLDFVFRVRKAGWRTQYVADAVIYHELLPSKTFEKGNYSEIYAKNRVRHWLIFLDRYGTVFHKLVFWLFTAPFLLLRVVLRELMSGNLKGIAGLFKGGFSFIFKKGNKK
jgi:GT2 family glycosyltransferase